MGLLNLEKLIASFREALGWPYVSPGTNDRNGIDCSGMFVRAYRLQGASISHGSNTIWRKYLSDRGEIHSADQLRPGMAVFKHRAADTAKYPDGQGDFFHIGLVVSANPPHIIHASTNGMKVREDRWSKAWTHWGYLRDVDYTEQNTDGGDRVDAWVKTPNNGVLNLRASKSKDSNVKARIPNGTKLTVLDRSDIVWYRVEYEGVRGWVMAEYLTETEPEVHTGVETGQSYQPASPPSAVTFAMFQALEKRVASIERLLYQAGMAATKGADP